MKEIDKSNFFTLEIIAPSNHPCIGSEFMDGTLKYTSAVNSVEDYGFFYRDCLQVFIYSRPDAVLVMGDRWEIQAAVTAAHLWNIPVAHIHGGESTEGAFDDEIRNSISMMSTWHFASTQEYARNLLNMVHYRHRNFERMYDSNIFVTGSPGYDSIKDVKLKSLEDLEGDFFIDLHDPFVIVAFHPVTKRLEHVRQHITNLLNALYRWGEQVIIVMPNIDPKNGVIREAIQEAASKSFKMWQICENIEHDTFLSLMRYASMMVGNSSAGVTEAVFFGLPVVNIGDRQGGRLKTENVFDCGYSEEEIFEKLGELQFMKEDFESGKVPLTKPDTSRDAAGSIVRILENKLGNTVEPNASECGSEAGD